MKTIIRNNRAILLLLGMELALAVFVALSMAGTFDEHTHWLYGKNVLLGMTDRKASDFESKSPLTALNSLPIAFGRQMQLYRINNALVDALADARSGRFVTIAFLLLLTWVLYRWAFELYGRQAALTAALLCILEPNLMAHGTLLTTDLYAALAMVAACFTAWRFLHAPSASRALAAAAVLGAAPLTKFSAMYLYPVLPVAVALAIIFGGRRVRPRLLALYAGAAIGFTVLFLNIGFQFRGTFTPLGGYNFESREFRRLESVPVLAAIPLPLPVPFLKGLDMTRAHEQNGTNFGNVYLLGEVRNSKDPNFKAFPAYYAVAYAVKEPISLQILLVAGVFLLCRRPWREFFADEVFLLLPALAIFAIFSFFNRAQIGIRHILPVLALLVPICASCFRNWRVLMPRQRLALGALVAYAAVSVLLYAPHFIPYMNELVWDKTYAYRVLADSNLDWQQDRWVIQDYVRHHPGMPVDPDRPSTGRVLAGANLLTGVLGGEELRWLREGCRPVGQVGYAHVLCEIAPPPRLARTAPYGRGSASTSVSEPRP